MTIRRGDVPGLTADPTLAKEELGFSAKKDFTTMSRDFQNLQSYPQQCHRDDNTFFNLCPI